jgi:predicted transcriptional regulator
MAEKRISGRPVTDAQIQAWADEAEAGYPVDQLRRRGRKALGDGPSDVVPVRMDADLLQALAERAEREHVTRSEAIRAAVRAWVGVA